MPTALQLADTFTVSASACKKSSRLARVQRALAVMGYVPKNLRSGGQRGGPVFATHLSTLNAFIRNTVTVVNVNFSYLVLFLKDLDLHRI